MSLEITKKKKKLHEKIRMPLIACLIFFPKRKLGILTFGDYNLLTLRVNQSFNCYCFFKRLIYPYNFFE
jgi:hypothetical protein